MTEPRIGLMLVGLRGFTGSCIEAGLELMRSGLVEERYGASSTNELAGDDLPGAAGISLGGWDVHRIALDEVVRRNQHLPFRLIEELRGCVGVAPYPAVVAPPDLLGDAVPPFATSATSLAQGAEIVAANIADFRDSNSVDHIIVVNLSSPSRRPEEATLALPIEQLCDYVVPSSVMYAYGAILAGADFVDFAPSPALEFRALWAASTTRGTRLVGRDGSTGQTMTKVLFSELFSRRNMPLKSWYSTNLIGNPDGLALTTEGFTSEKLADKTDALQDLVGTGTHHVDIVYLPEWGDRKEAWDAVEVDSWLGSNLSLRISWRGSDSELAAPLVLDLARLLTRARHLGSTGFRPEFGFFFKRPFEREDVGLSQRWLELVAAVGPPRE